MRSAFLKFSLEIGLLSLAACGIHACSSDHIPLTVGGSGSTTTTGTGGAGASSSASSSAAVVAVASGAGTLAGATGSGGSGGDKACADTLLITYDVTGKLATTDTPSGLGDGVRDIGPGTMQIRYQANGSNPTAGYTILVSYHMPMKYSVDVQGVVITTDVTVDAGPNECGIAMATPIGLLLDWDMCQYDPLTWTTQVAGTGDGCVHGYHTMGNVNCNDMSMLAACTDFGLMDGDNPQNRTWDQPLNTLEYASDLKSFSMQNLDGPAPPAGTMGVEMPNDVPGRTWLSLSATEKTRVLGYTPPCACSPP